ncbi:molybdopterin molybdotransferase MoeA [Spirochaeta lutea]|uniref:Molybdopterin molybdenumtransferase n=1 Tax=Spirochaeta lutea TaxID=1480694 RepID=A0A098QSZ5_9SPIO|nr:molybdopterin molybdotransferase MoeA [Spirochaeta lutea]KGE70995.1 hypothetical protein DC28_13805 [Spirochaeta lutea]
MKLADTTTVQTVIAQILAAQESSRDDGGVETIPLERALGRCLARDLTADRHQPPFNRSAMDGIAIARADLPAAGPQNTLDCPEEAWCFQSLGILAAGQDPGPLAHPGFSGNTSQAGRTPSESEARPSPGAVPLKRAAGTRDNKQAPPLPPCVEIMTGAAVPPGFDTVIRYEDLQRSPDSQAAGKNPPSPEPGPEAGPVRWICRGSIPARGANIHPRGADYQKGAVILEGGQIITSSHIAVLASCGYTQVPLRTLPSITIVATGDELVSPDTTPLDHQIRASNHLSIAGELTSWGFPPGEVRLCPDDPQALTETIRRGLKESRVLILTGAVSKGAYDHIPGILEGLGVEIRIHGVSQRPGKPLLVGRARKAGRADSLVLGLPGNPVSALINLRRYLIPALALQSIPGSSGRIWAPGPASPMSSWAALGFPLRLAREITFEPPLTYYPGVSLEMYQGELTLVPVRGNGSGDFFHLSKTAGFIVMPKDRTRLEAGSLVQFYPWGV